MNSDRDNTASWAGTDIVNPWEERKDRGRVSALVSALALLVTSPRRFFEGTRADAGIWGPLLFVGLVTVLGFLVNGVLLTVLALTLPEPALDLVYLTEFWIDPDTLRRPEALSFGPVLNAFIAVQGLLLFLPVLFALTLFFMLVFGALLHLLLVVTRTSRPHGFRGTWAAICYAHGASLLGIMPVAGEYLAIIGNAVLFGIGLHVVQRVGAVRAAVLATILPLLSLLSLLSRLAIAGAEGAGP